MVRARVGSRDPPMKVHDFFRVLHALPMLVPLVLTRERSPILFQGNHPRYKNLKTLLILLEIDDGLKDCGEGTTD
jgi:hypothetical protein